MIEYSGYQLRIGEFGGLYLPIPEGEEKSIIENGSYSFRKERRVAEQWQDANGEIHRALYPKEKATITFTIKERSMRQNNKLSKLWALSDDNFVEYYDDSAGRYKTGRFFIESIEAITSISTDTEVYYAPVSVTLTEY